MRTQPPPVLRASACRAGVLISFSAAVLAQAGTWTQQAPLPTGSTCFSVAALSPTEYWVTAPALGTSNSGRLAHTTNAGETWEYSTFASGGVNAVFFLDALHGWTAGNGFHHTVDGGQTWVQDNSWGSIYDLFFVDAQHGWACGNGGVTYRTTNGGASWSAVSAPAGTTLRAIWFNDLQRGWCVSIGGRILRTTDGGQTWTINHDSGAYLTSIQFLSPAEGWATGGNTFLHTTNGGASWVPVSVPAGTWSHGARFADSNHGVAVGQEGNIIATQNGGVTWSTVAPMGNGMLLWDVEYCGGQSLICCGNGGAIRLSADFGQTWGSIQNGGLGKTRGLDAVDEARAWAANEGGEVLRTTNGGARWDRVTVDGFDLSGELHDVDFVSPSLGWVVGKQAGTSGNSGRISRSTDGGLTWQLQSTQSGVDLYGVLAFDSQRVIAHGRNSSSGALYRTTDGGQTWTPSGPTSSSGFTSSCAVDSSRGWLVGQSVYRTLDAGATWTQLFTNPSTQLLDVSFADPLNGWVVSYLGLVLHTTDGGLTWTQQNAGAPGNAAITAVRATSATEVWVAGWSGFVARTTDAGATWTTQSLPGTGTPSFECLEFGGAGRGWVGGDLGIWRWQLDQVCPDTYPYCVSLPNTSGAAATIGFTGSCVAADNDFTLQTLGVPNQPFIYFFGATPQIAPLGNGFLCISGSIIRLQPVAFATGGVATRSVDLPTWGLNQGSVVFFQCWYRDPFGPGATFNFSDGLQVSFQ